VILVALNILDILMFVDAVEVKFGSIKM